MTDRRMRADARRNQERIVAAARDTFAALGADAPLDEIARRAGVGSGTLYRHFPTRTDLLLAVYSDGVNHLCRKATDLAGSQPPSEALTNWLHALVRFWTTKRGLSIDLIKALEQCPAQLTQNKQAIREAAGELLTTAQRDGGIRPEVEVTDLLKLAHGIALATEQTPDQAERLLSLVLTGLRGLPGQDEGASPLRT
jgi:AcrR family transcriptional regulator